MTTQEWVDKIIDKILTVVPQVQNKHDSELIEKILKENLFEFRFKILEEAIAQAQTALEEKLRKIQKEAEK